MPETRRELLARSELEQRTLIMNKNICSKTLTTIRVAQVSGDMTTCNSTETLGKNIFKNGKKNASKANVQRGIVADTATLSGSLCSSFGVTQ